MTEMEIRTGAAIYWFGWKLRKYKKQQSPRKNSIYLLLFHLILYHVVTKQRHAVWILRKY